MTMPPAGLDLPPNPAGNFYRGQAGMLVHRVTLRDAYAAGHQLFDNKGQPMSYEAFASDAANRAQMPFNYDLEHVMGGSAAIDLLALLVAQQRGARNCAFVFLDDRRADLDFERTLNLLRAHLGSGAVGVGFDIATTTKETSNPSAVTVTESNGVERAQRLVVCWKEKQPQVVRERLRRIFEVIAARPVGGGARRFCIAAGSERYFAQETADVLGSLVPTELVIEGASVLPAGYREKVSMKTYLGDVYSAAVNDNHYALPADEYFKADQRMTVKSAGRYECTPDPRTGAHGDTFVSGEMAEYALRSGDAAMADGVDQRPHDRSDRGHYAGASGGRMIGGMV